jgi:putative membrane protein
MFASITSFAMPFLQMWNGDHMDGDRAFGGWFVMALVMLLFWGTVAVFGVWALRSSHSHSAPATGPSPIDIARERYARGEITDEEFERIKRGLK